MDLYKKRERGFIQNGNNLICFNVIILLRFSGYIVEQEMNNDQISKGNEWNLNNFVGNVLFVNFFYFC
jgi:hypothetical protein